MIAALLGWMRRRWDVALDPVHPVAFASIRRRINLKWLELLGWVGLINLTTDAVAGVGLGMPAYLVWSAVIVSVYLAIIAAARWSLRRGTPRWQGLLPPLAIMLVLLMGQGSVALIATTGRLSTTYPLGLLTIALLFVLPPRVLMAIMATSFVTITIANQASSTGTLAIGAASGQPAVAAGTVQAGTVASGDGTGTLVLNHTGNPVGSAVTFAPTITGAGSVRQLVGTTILRPR